MKLSDIERDGVPDVLGQLKEISRSPWAAEEKARVPNTVLGLG